MQVQNYQKILGVLYHNFNITEMSFLISLLNLLCFYAFIYGTVFSIIIVKFRFSFNILPLKCHG